MPLTRDAVRYLEEQLRGDALDLLLDFAGTLDATAYESSNASLPNFTGSPTLSIRLLEG
jgi:hypothetical protein